jgi:hypothetical protein
VERNRQVASTTGPPEPLVIAVEVRPLCPSAGFIRSEQGHVLGAGSSPARLYMCRMLSLSRFTGPSADSQFGQPRPPQRLVGSEGDKRMVWDELGYTGYIDLLQERLP